MTKYGDPPGSGSYRAIRRGRSDTKVVVLPVLLGGLLLFAVWAWLSSRRVPTAVWLSVGILGLSAAVLWMLQYRGHSSGLILTLSLSFFDGMGVVVLIKAELIRALPDFPGLDTLLSAGGVVVGLLGLLAAQLVA